MADTTFTAVAETVAGMKTKCTARGMSIILDEPVSLGGTDEGMNPVEALLSALGACKAIVANAFARHQKMTINGVRIELEGVLDPDGFQGKNPDAKIGFSKINTRYQFDSPNTPEEIEAYVEFIEAHCPVHDTLANPAELTHEIV